MPTSDLLTDFRSASPEQIIRASGGMGNNAKIGKILVIDGLPPLPKEESLPDDQIEPQQNQLQQALIEAKDALESALLTTADLPMEIRQKTIEMLEFQQAALISLGTKANGTIAANNMPAIPAVVNVCGAMIAKLEKAHNRHNIADIENIQELLLRSLLIQAGFELNTLSLKDAPNDGRVIMAHCPMSPSDTIHLLDKNIRGLVMVGASPSGHVAILAKELGIPCLFVDGLPDGLHNDVPVILDPGAKTAFISPSTKTLEKYRHIIEGQEKRTEARQAFRGIQITTQNNEHVSVYANISYTGWVKRANLNSADGVGLYRTEFLFSSQEKEPTIPFQKDAYAYVLKGMEGHSVTIRLCDIEGDKNEQEWLKKTDRWELWDRQIEAILRASAQENIRAHILVPTVRDASEMQLIRTLVEKNTEKLKNQGFLSEKPAKVGMMVETPIAALDMDSYAGLADFYSIGSNDLMASLTGIQRTDQHLSQLSDITQPRVLKVFQEIIAAAHTQGKKISLCGGLASQPDMIGILIGLGLRRLSAGVENVLEIKERIRMIDSGQAKNMVETLMRTPSRAERENILSRFNQDLLAPNIVSPNSTISALGPEQRPA